MYVFMYEDSMSHLQILLLLVTTLNLCLPLLSKPYLQADLRKPQPSHTACDTDLHYNEQDAAGQAC